MWIAVEGIDGVGKSTALSWLVQDGILGEYLDKFPENEDLKYWRPSGPCLIKDQIYPGVDQNIPRPLQHFLSRSRWVVGARRIADLGILVVTDRSWMSNYVYADPEFADLIFQAESMLPRPDGYVVLGGYRRPKADDPDGGVLSRAWDAYLRMDTVLRVPVWYRFVTEAMSVEECAHSLWKAIQEMASYIEERSQK